MEARQFAELNQARNYHFDVYVGCVMTQVNETKGPRAELARTVVAGAPVINYRRIESRFVKLVFDKDPPVVRQRGVDLAHAFEIARERAGEMLLPRVISAVAHPDRMRCRTQRLSNLDALDVVRHGLCAHFRVDVRP